jgi:hypothetical protein
MAPKCGQPSAEAGCVDRMHIVGLADNTAKADVPGSSLLVRLDCGLTVVLLGLRLSCMPVVDASQSLAKYQSPQTPQPDKDSVGGMLQKVQPLSEFLNSEIVLDVTPNPLLSHLVE